MCIIYFKSTFYLQFKIINNQNRNEENSDETTEIILIEFLKKIVNNNEEINEEKDIQLICTTISGRNILAKFLFYYPEDYYSIKQNADNLKSDLDFNNNKNSNNNTILLKEKNFILLSNLISASLMSIHENMEKLNFENTKLLTLCLFKFYM